MKIHIHNIGECGKCGMSLSTYLSSSRFGLKGYSLTDSPEECDLLIITGCMAKSQEKRLMEFWKKMPRGHRILSFGNCGTYLQNLFKIEGNENIKNKAISKQDISEILPIDYILEGCPPNLDQITQFFKEI